MRGWEALASQGKATDKESGMGELLTCPMSLPLPLRWLGMLALKMSLFILSLAAACPSPGLGGLIFGRNFYRAERNSGVTCRALGCCIGAGGACQRKQQLGELLDTVPLTGSHKSLVWAAHKGWGEYYCRSRVKLCCGPGPRGPRGGPWPGRVRTNGSARRSCP